MVKCRAKDYNEYNRALHLFDYGLLHRILDDITHVHKLYKIPIDEDEVTYFESETGDQIELNGTMYLPVNIRVQLHLIYLQKIWKLRYKNKRIIKQLSLF